MRDDVAASKSRSLKRMEEEWSKRRERMEGEWRQKCVLGHLLNESPGFAGVSI